ncbi:hypothetical protein H5410_015071 [Solanum commersonii]|uniref:Uncharacterized protein n=1 Tax=Solanum commersonii TaxID=4109 RepID=A0A9J5ZTD0_SOLCO|nr:hypothetical protein H5410_015071 [Solanum commersonii]
MTGSDKFQRFYPANTRKFSNIIIKRVLTPEEWGMSPLKQNEYIHPEQKIAVKYNYWDYSSWFIKYASKFSTNQFQIGSINGGLYMVPQ